MGSAIVNHKKTVTLLIVDDHEMLRDGLKVMLTTNNETTDFRIWEARTAQEAIRITTIRRPEVILMDFNLPEENGAFAAREILKLCPDTKLLALSSYNEEAYIEMMIEAGALGYILKNIGRDQLLDAINTILKKELYFSAEPATKLLAAGKKIARPAHKRDKLTKREAEILTYIADGLSSEEISIKLHLSARTIETHRQNLMQKLKVRNIAGLLKEGYKKGLLSIIK